MKLIDRRYVVGFVVLAIGLNTPRSADLPGRIGYGMAYDTAREQVVLFGGGNGDNTELFDDTWVWQGAGWIQLHPLIHPEKLSGILMAYDDDRQVTVLFGGGAEAQTWEWAGTNWQKRNPANSPSNRINYGLAYDSARHRTVLFGGRAPIANNTQYLGDTWVWDGTNWEEQHPINSPSVRGPCGMAYDNERQEIVLFSGAGAPGDTWVWTGNDWSKRNPAVAPPGRGSSGNQLAYDAERKNIVLFGGFNGYGALNDTWIWDGTNWVEKIVDVKPSGRWVFSMAYDAATKQTVLFGGWNGTTSLNDTWLWNGTSWTAAQGVPGPGWPGFPQHGWLFDEGTATTVSATWGGQSGAFGGSPSWSSSIPISYAGNHSLEFHHADVDYLDLGSNVVPHGDSAWKDFSISCWIKPGPVEGQYRTIIADYVVSSQNYGTKGNFNLVLTPDERVRLYVWAEDGFTPRILTSVGKITLGTWNHIAAISKEHGSIIGIYLNGVEESGSSVSVSYGDPNPINTRIGSVGGGQYPFEGNIDEVLIWNTALTTENVQWLAAHTINPAAPAISGLVSWWPFNGSVADAEGRNNPTASNGIRFVSAQVGQGALFSTGSFIDIPPSASLANQEFTWEAWVRPDGPGPNNDQYGSVIVQPGPISNFALYGLWWSASDSRFIFGFGNSSSDLIVSSTSFTVGNFYHVLATSDGSMLKLFVNGLLEGERNFNVPLEYNSPRPWTIGSTAEQFRSGGGPRTWEGVIDEVRIYNRALALSEILTPPCTPPPSGLVAWWPGEGNADDAINREQGTLQNGASFAQGKVGQAFRLDGMGAYVNLGASPSFDISDFTVGAWVLIEPSSNTNDQRIISRDDFVPPNYNERRLYVLKSSAAAGGAAGHAAFGFGASPAGVFQGASVIAPTALSAGWHYLAGTRAADTASLYIDGVIVGTDVAPVSLGVIAPKAPLVLGQISSTVAGEFFNGLIDEVVLLNRALSASEIVALYSAGGAGMCAIPVPDLSSQPTNQVVSLGGSVTLRVAASGFGPFSYQWHKNGNAIPGANSAILTLSPAELEDGGSYTVVVSNASGSVESNPALLQIELPPIALTDQFADRQVFTPSNSAGFTNNVAATAESGEPRHAGKRGGKSLWMTWKAPASGVVTFSTVGSSFDTTLAVYTGSAVNALTEVASDEDSGGFLTSKLKFNAVAGTDHQIAVDGFAGASGVIVLSWDLVADAPALPVITQQPKSVLAVVGDAVQFTVSAQPVGVTYQWLLNGQALIGQTAPVLSLTADASRVGTYRARVTAPNGQTLDSADAILEVLDQPQPNLRLSADKLDDLFDPSEIALAKLSRISLSASLPVSQGWMQEADMSQSTRSPEDPEPCGVITSVTRWFRIRPIVPASGRAQVRLSTEGSDVPTVLGVFTNRFALTLVRCSPGTDANSKNAVVGFDAVQGVDYLVMVGRLGEGAGKVRLSYRGAEELPDFARVSGLEAGRLQVQILVVPGKYDWSWSDDVRTWTPMFQTNVPSGLFQYSEPLQLSAPVRLFRLLPGK